MKKKLLPTPLPFYMSRVQAGFPSPAEDYIEKTLDFNEYLIKNRASTFCMRVHGDSMINAGIFDNDILIVDRSINAQNNHIVIAVINSEFTVKRFLKRNNGVWLLPENPRYKPIKISSFESFEIWGVVTNVIHQV